MRIEECAMHNLLCHWASYPSNVTQRGDTTSQKKPYLTIMYYGTECLYTEHTVISFLAIPLGMDMDSEYTLMYIQYVTMYR